LGEKKDDFNVLLKKSLTGEAFLRKMEKNHYQHKGKKRGRINILGRKRTYRRKRPLRVEASGEKLWRGVPLSVPLGRNPLRDRPPFIHGLIKSQGEFL